MTMPDLDDVSEVHVCCPFCDGEYVIVEGAVRHSIPTCKRYEELPPLAFKKEAELEERRRCVTSEKR